MNALHQIITSLGGLNARALLRTGLIATALVAFAAVAIPIAGAVSGHGTSAAIAAECEEGDEDERCQEEPTKTPDDRENDPTKTPEEEEPTKTPDDTPTNTPVDTATPTDVPMDTPTEVPMDTPTDVPTDVPTDTPEDRPTDVPTEQPEAMPTDMPVEPVALPDSGSGFGPADLVLSWYWYVLVAALLAIGLGVLIKPSYN